MYWYAKEYLCIGSDCCGVFQTIGGFISTLTEMGFSEDQIQAAMQAGFFSVPDAAEW